MSNFSGYWKIITPASRKNLYTTLSTDAYDPRTTDLSSLSSVQWYSQVLRGPGSRAQSYKQYNAMDADIDISRSLDIIAEEMSNKDEKTKLPFVIDYQKEDNQDISDSTVVTLRQAVRQWSDLHDFKLRIFSIARTLIKYGDCFFRKTSDTKRWVYVDPSLVYGIEVDENGNKISYHIKQPGTGLNNPYAARGEQVDVIPAAAIIHFTLSDDMGDSAPFGPSILRPIYRVYRQMAMMEDAVIIYRIVRAPERRVFYVDVGNMPPQRVKQYLEQIKNELRQKRSPTAQGGKDTVDGAYDPQCLVMSTRIPLLDGRTLTLEEIAKEFDAGKKNWVYSCDPKTGAVQPGEIEWAGVTRKNAEVIKLTFDNGKEVTCTPDHKFPVQGLGFVRADELTTEMSLIPFTKRWKIGNDIREEAFHSGYEEIYDIAEQDWKKTHQMVRSNVDLNTKVFRENDEKKTTIHHDDFNKHNNNPENLVFMGAKDHWHYHSAHNKARFAAWSPEEQSAGLKRLHAGLKKTNDSLSDERSKREQRRGEKISAAFLARGMNKCNRRKSDAPEALGQRLKTSSKMFSLICNKIKEDPSIRRNSFIEWLASNENFLSAFKEVNTGSPTGRKSKPTWTFLEVLKEEKETHSFAEFKQKMVLFNHKIIKIERLTERVDTGCLTVGESIHDHHTFALDAGLFTRNSLSEDLFMPVTAAGRGSRVETLPGGTEDFGSVLLKYFQEKIFRGLRIPTSYLGGADGAGAQYNDGKVGIAYIEELRFAQFIKRMQDRMAKVFDEEFKVYLKVVGLRVDDEIFKLDLPDPANFALYRQAALDADLVGSFNNIASTKYLSSRFMLKRYLGLTDDEIQMNEVMIKEERNISDNANVSALQQMYDPAVVENREAVSVEAPVGGEEEIAGGLGDEADIGNTDNFFGSPEPAAPAEEPAAEVPAEIPAEPAVP